MWRVLAQTGAGYKTAQSSERAPRTLSLLNMRRFDGSLSRLTDTNQYGSASLYVSLGPRAAITYRPSRGMTSENRPSASVLAVEMPDGSPSNTYSSEVSCFRCECSRSSSFVMLLVFL